LKGSFINYQKKNLSKRKKDKGCRYSDRGNRYGSAVLWEKAWKKKQLTECWVASGQEEETQKRSRPFSWEESNRERWKRETSGEFVEESAELTWKRKKGEDHPVNENRP